MAATRTFAILGLLALAAPAAAERHVSGTGFYYSDSDHVRVLSPALTGEVAAGPLSATAHATVDIVSAASVDLVSAASPRGFSERRVQLDVDLAHDLGAGRKLDALFEVSREPDFVTFTGGAGAAWDVRDRNATVGARYAFSRARIGRTDDSRFGERRDWHQIELSYSPLLGSSAVADLVYTLGIVDGYQANPYRYVRLYAPGAAGFATSVVEHVPDLRLRHAGIARVRARLSRALFGMAEYRAYGDSWGVLAHSAMLRAMLDAGGFTFTADARGYQQTGASFYRRRYDTFPSAPAYRTGEKELGPLWTVLGGLHVSWRPPLAALDSLRVGAGGDLLAMRYLEHPQLTWRIAEMLSLDVTVEF